MKSLKKHTVAIIALSVSLIAVGCSGSANTAVHSSDAAGISSTNISEKTSPAFGHPDKIQPELVKSFEEYIALTESYIEDSSFEFVENSHTENLSQLLSGHYEVIGRSDKNGREYYLALRRSDAPEYDDFHSLSIGNIDNKICQIGYYTNDIDETILYCIPDFSVKAFWEKEGQEILDMFCFFPEDILTDEYFSCAFDVSGRLQLDFLKHHPGLAFHITGNSCIDFLYQDEDTTGKNYGNFTDTWFELPLASASLDFPVLKAAEGRAPSANIHSQTISEPEKLVQLSTLLSNAIQGPESLSRCPYTGVLTLTRQDGEVLHMFVASDSCDSITYEGRTGFEYGNQKDLADIFDKAMPFQE